MKHDKFVLITRRNNSTVKYAPLISLLEKYSSSQFKLKGLTLTIELNSEYTVTGFTKFPKARKNGKKCK